MNYRHALIILSIILIATTFSIAIWIWNVNIENKKESDIFQGDKAFTTNKPLIALVGEDPSSSVVIACYTVVSQTNLILTYYFKGTSNESTALDSGSGTEHRFFLTNLVSNATYIYFLAINNSAGPQVPSDLSQIQSFKTTPSRCSEGFTFLEVSDIHSRMPPELASTMANIPADLIIEDGDLTDFGSSNADWDAYFASTHLLFAHPYDATSSPLLVPVVGDHDTMVYAQSSFGELFWGVGNVAPMPSSNYPYYYRVDIEDVHFIMLDIEWGIQDFTVAQETWLNATLASINKTDWIFLVEHCMIYSSGSFGTQVNLVNKIEPILKEGNVSLVIAGHDHDYERMIEGNLTYIVQGTGGGNPDPRSPTQIAGSQCYITGQEYGSGGMFGKYVITNDTLTFTSYFGNGSIVDTAVVSH